MSRFKTTTIDTNNVGSWVERRRKGRMIRKQHTVTGKWSPWMIGEPVSKVGVIAKGATWTGTVEGDYARMTVAELRTLAGNRGIKVPSKSRKSEIITALTN